METHIEHKNVNRVLYFFLIYLIYLLYCIIFMYFSYMILIQYKYLRFAFMYGMVFTLLIS